MTRIAQWHGTPLARTRSMVQFSPRVIQASSLLGGQIATRGTGEDALIWYIGCACNSGADPLAELRAGQRRMLNSISFAVVVTNWSYIQCSFVEFNGFTTKKR